MFTNLKISIFNQNSDDFVYDLMLPAAISRPPTLAQNLES